MKKIIATYDHVIVPSEAKQKHPNKRKSSGIKNKPSKYLDTPSRKNSDKDEKAHAEMEERAERLAEDPFMTPAEMKNMDGGLKEKEKKVEDSDSENSWEENSKNKAQDAKKELDVLASRSDKILLEVHGLFPFDFFPDTLRIDANKVNIIIKTFFMTETATSVLIKEIMDVRVESSLFLGKLIIDYGPHPLKISTVYVPSLLKKDALKAKEIIEGLLVVYRAENIDTTKLKPEETIDEIKQIGEL